MFEKASRLKLRFESSQGLLSTEELWSLDLRSLDNLAKHVHKLLMNEAEESFIPTTARKPSTHNELRLDILKHIIAVRVAEDDARKSRAENRAKLARLKEIEANKSESELASKSLEEIQKQIAELEAAELAAV